MRGMLSVFLSLGVALGMLVIAPPSQAATTCDNYLLADPVGPSVAVGGTVTITVTCYNGSPAVDTTFTGIVSATTSALSGSVTVNAPTVTAAAGVATFTVTGGTAGMATVLFATAATTGGGNKTVTSILTVTSGGGGGGGGASSGTAANTPVEVSLSLDLGASGASCTEGSAATGTTGSWLKLPGAGDCSSKTEPKATLLGWATTADFPVEIAQRQIRNGWGAYEMFDSEGRMTAVFIPAGQATFVSGPNSLHPVWAK